MSDLTYNDLKTYVLNNKLFRDPSLTSERLSNLLTVSNDRINFLILKGCGFDFKCFINRLRVAEAKRMLEETTFYGFSVDAIGRMSGFNSRHEFNHTFRELTGVLPKEYKVKLKPFLSAH